MSCRSWGTSLLRISRGTIIGHSYRQHRVTREQPVDAAVAAVVDGYGSPATAATSGGAAYGQPSWLVQSGPMVARSGTLEAMVLGALTLALLLGGGMAAARFTTSHPADQMVTGSFSPSFRADYSPRDELRIPPQQQATTPTPPRPR